MNQVIIDVRENDEFDAAHIENALHIPLAGFGSKAPAILKALSGQEVVPMCLGGKRAKRPWNRSCP